MSIKEQLSKYKDAPLKVMLKYIETDVLDKIVIPNCSLRQIIQLSNAIKNNSIKFDFVINQLQESDCARIIKMIQNEFQSERELANKRNALDKYNLLIAMINKINDINQLKRIEKLTDFKDINKSIFTNPKNVAVFEEYGKELLTMYRKRKFKWIEIHKLGADGNIYFAVNLLRRLCKDCGFRLDCTRKNLKTDRVITTRFYYIVRDDENEDVTIPQRKKK